jgi:hypothetical protein
MGGAVVLAASLMLGCAATQMQVPDLGDSPEVHPIDRPKVTSAIGTQEFKMGPYVAVEFDLGGTGTSSAGVGGFSKSQSSQDVTYTLHGPDAKVGARCEIATSQKAIAGFGKVNKTLTCEFDDGSALSVSAGADGTVSGGGVELRVTATKAIEGGDTSTFKPTGYLFYQGDAQVGGVDINGTGILYLSARLDAPARLLVALAAPALLVFDE